VLNESAQQHYAILLGCDTCFIYELETGTWQERKSYRSNVNDFGLVLDNQTLCIAGGSSKWFKIRTAEVSTVSVRDVIEDNRRAIWKHHATLPQPACIHAFGLVPLYRPWSASLDASITSDMQETIDSGFVVYTAR